LGKLRVLSGREVCKILEQNSFVQVRQRGSHIIMQLQIEDSTVTVPVPNQVEAGETFVIMQADKAIAELKPITTTEKKMRPFGLCAGEFTVADDFDAPLPEEIVK
jgi:predicted RNA binding protein YcfA (HicA-like mRNA interferase family)